MAVIFCGSSDSKSGPHTEFLFGPFLHWLFPHASEEFLENAIFCIRKLAHLTEYAFLSLLLYRAFARPVIRAVGGPWWRWPVARRALLLLVFYAATDEFHQIFVPTREARVGDVLIDTCGGAAALAALWVISRVGKRKSS